MIKIKKYQIEDYISDATQDALDIKADLVDGKVPASQLPSFVDDVIEVANYAALPIPGASGVIYITLDTNKVYRWSGSVYVEIASGVTNLSYTPGVSNGTVNSDTGSDAIIPLAGTVNAGLFSAAEKSKLEGIAPNANVGVIPNAPITGATKTKITYDTKGLVTAGADATTADIADSTNKRYVTDANLTVINNTSGTNTGDQDLQSVTDNGSTTTNSITADSFIKSGGLSTEYLMADGTTTTGGGSQNLQDVTDIGASTTNAITALSFIKDGGFDFQFLKADGSVDNNTYLTSADLPSTLDLYATTSPDPVISSYTALVRNITDTRYNTVAVDVPTPLVNGTIASPTFCGAVISDPSVLLGNPGVFNFTVIGNIRRVSGSTSSGADFFYSIYKRDLAGTETFIADSAKVPVPANGGVYIEYISTALWNDGIFLSTDRIVLKFYGIQTGGGTGAYYEFLFGGDDPVRGTASISSAIIPNIYLRDLADVEKTPALDNEILYWNDTDSLWEHSAVVDLIPDASATQRGLVSIGAQTFAGNKTFTGATSIITNSLDLGIQVNSNDVGIEVNASGIGIEVYGILAPAGVFNLASTNTSNIVEFKKDYVVKAAVSNDGKITATAGTASTDVVVKSQLDTKQNTITLSAIGSVPNANAATLTGSVLNIQPASASFGGVVTTGTQTFAGAKTFNSPTEVPITALSTSEYAIFAGSDNNTAIFAQSINGVAVYGYTDNGIGVDGYSTNNYGIKGSSGGAAGGVFETLNGSNIAEFKTFNVLKASITSAGTVIGTGLNASGQTASTIASFDANKNVVSLTTANGYPTLTELKSLVGVSTTAIQTQLNAKQPTLTLTTTGSSGAATLIGSTLNIPQYSGGGSLAQTGQIILTSGTSTILPATITTSTIFRIELIGGGGGGGGGSSTNQHGSGGGAGGYVYKELTGFTGGGTLNYTIGAAGNGGASASNGTAGTSTTLTAFSVVYTASGGGAGLAAISSAGGVGGVGTNGDINMTGQAGDGTPSGQSLATASARGGDAPKGWGSGGSSVIQSRNGNAGTGYGSGGSSGKLSTFTGGAGAQGIIVITWFN
jgi:hypothetical protein